MIHLRFQSVFGWKMAGYVRISFKGRYSDNIHYDGGT